MPLAVLRAIVAVVAQPANKPDETTEPKKGTGYFFL